MVFAQLTYRESLRDIEACLGAVPDRLYHMGIRSTVSRSTLADANEKRNWRIYADFAQVLILEARQLYAGDSFGVELEETVYALDSTTISLCLSLFPWAHFRRTKSAIKLHTLLDLRGSIPSFLRITEARSSDVSLLDELVPEAGAIYVMDRGYVDFARLYNFTLAQASFVVRAKKNLRFKRRYSRDVDRTTGLICDQTIVLVTARSAEGYPEPLRRVRVRDLETDKTITLLTNNFRLSAWEVAELYRCRWHVELFFKWIKQHLRIKAFYGTSDNAVRTQIWIAICSYVLVAILKKRLHSELSLYTMLQILSVSLFEKIELSQAFSRAKPAMLEESTCNQLRLFDL
jgi:IS4 transposase